MKPSKKIAERELEALTERLEDRISGVVKLSAELEFYVEDNSILPRLEEAVQSVGLAAEVVEEKGPNQCEIQSLVPSSAVETAHFIQQSAGVIRAVAGRGASFDPKPFANGYGNAMHIHISLHDKNGNNLLEKHAEDECPMMLHAMGGLCKFLPESMALFAPTEGCYKRFVPKWFAPVNVSWGGNNRTVAMRIPDPRQSGVRRIEHRVPSAIADPYEVIAAILAGVDAGIDNKLMPPKKMYGDAGDAQYALPPFPKNLEEAWARLMNSRWGMEYGLVDE